VQQDYAEAVRWYRNAAEQGDSEAESKLKHLFLLMGKEGQVLKSSETRFTAGGYVVSAVGVLAVTLWYWRTSRRTGRDSRSAHAASELLREVGSAGGAAKTKTSAKSKAAENRKKRNNRAGSMQMPSPGRGAAEEPTSQQLSTEPTSALPSVARPAAPKVTSAVEPKKDPSHGSELQYQRRSPSQAHANRR
jgi:hypothetical protein